MEKKQRVFQVNLKGMISLLSEHIYSNPGTFVRELLQNGVDAITAFRSLDESHRGEVDITLCEDGTMQFRDNGIGLKEEEIHEVLTVIGESSKRGELDSQDFIGRFGIGLLSCFVVSNEIVFITRSAMSPQAIRWCGKADGTYETETLEGEYPIGTLVVLTPKQEWNHLFEYETFRRNLVFYGNALPYPIRLKAGEKEEVVNDENPLWLSPGASREDLLAEGRKLFNSSFLDAFPVSTENGKIRGTIYILPFKTQFSGRLSHRIYLKRMLLSEEDCNLLPSWAFFVKCVLNAETLSSTASREALVSNEELRKAREEIGKTIKEHLKVLMKTDPDLFARILNVHFLHIKAIASEDTEMFHLFMDALPFETNKGVRSFATIRRKGEPIYYTCNLDDFKQVKRIALSQGMMVINAAYTFDETLLKKAARLFTEVEVKQISPSTILDSFTEADRTGNPHYTAFEEQCNAILKRFGCVCKLKHFAPADTPVIFVAGEKGADVKEKKAGAGALNAIAGAFASKKRSEPTLCMNVDNELVRMLIRMKEPVLFEAIVDILYVQSLLLGKYPVNTEEMNLFNESLYKLIIMGMSDILNELNKK